MQHYADSIRPVDLLPNTRSLGYFTRLWQLIMWFGFECNTMRYTSQNTTKLREPRYIACLLVWRDLIISKDN